MKRQDSLDPNTVETVTVTHGAPTDIVVIEDAVEHQSLSSDDIESGAEANSRDLGTGVVIISRTTRDRAAVVTIVLKQICGTVQGRERWQAVEDYLRDEIADIERQIAADRESVDA